MTPGGDADCPICNGNPGKGGCGNCGGTYDGTDD
jgi:hypothetical protein